ncbi:MAG: hypothetical protein KDB11_18845 [Planctomycetales bacterium]|nr:hypothetical protein [Planctomycetales bacterium]
MGTLMFTPTAELSGSAIITVTVTDGGFDQDLGTSVDNGVTLRSFTITVLSVNDAPTLLSVDDVTVGEDAPEQTVALTGISAGGGESQPLSILATSDNVSLIANPTVVYTSGDTSGSLRFTPTADLSGSAIITVTLTDGGLDQNLTTTSDNGVTQRSFTITVQAVNDVPTIDATADLPALSEDASEQIVSLHGLSAGEGEDQPLRVIATSTNQTLIPNPTVDFIDGQSVATLRFTPIANRSGTSVITVIVTDGGLDRDLNTAADNATVETTFLVVVNSGNDEVTLDPISNPVAVKEDSSAQVVALTGISAGAGESQPLSITAVSSNVSLTGQLIVDYESPNQTATIRYTPVADQSGQATITVTVTDGGLDGDLQTSDDNASLSRNFTITVDAENDSPTLDPLDSFSIEEEATGQVISLTGISAGGGESQLLRVSAISSLPSLIPHPIVTYTSAQSSGTLNLRPMPNQSGEAVITVTVTDAGLDGDINLTTDNGTVSRVFTVTVDAVNDPPALNAISNLEINEDAPTQTVNLSGISAGGGESQPLSITVSSDNPGLIPTPSVQYISPNTIGAIQFAPVKDQHGTAVITLTLTDGGLDGDISTGADNLSSVRTFAVTVNSENDPPSFEALSQISIAENAAVQRIVLTGISAGGGENQPLSVVAISNQPSLIQSPTVDYVSGEATAEVSFQPAAAASGVATIALTLTDGGLDGDLDTEEDNGSTTRVLTVAVRPVNDLPTLDQPINVTINEDSGEHMVLLTGVTAGPGESQPLSVTLRADREDLISNRSLEYVSPNDVATLRFTSAPDTSGVVVFTTTVTDGGLDGDLATTSDNASVERAFTVYIAPVNDPPTLNAISNLSLPEDAAEQAVNLAGITSGPGENQPLLVNVSSSNPSLIPAPTVQYISPSGTGSIRLQPAPNQSGFAVITVKVIDGGLDNDLATAFDNRTAEQSFTVAVAAENDLPTLDAITSFEIMENSPTRTIDLTGISAGGGEFQPLEITATSSNPQLIPAPSVQYSSPTTFGSVRLTPNANQQGTAVIGITLTDGGLDGDLSTLADNRSVTQSFTVVVLGQNQPPTFSAPSQLNILEDAPLQTVALTNIRDDGAQGQPLGLVVASTDPTLIPTPTLSYEAGSSTAEIRFAPVAGASGQATISLIVSDGGLDNDLATTEDNASTVHSILVTVVPVNDAPSLDPISDLTLDEDSGEHAITLTGITAGADESQPLNVTVRADRDDLIPTRTVEYATPSGQATFRFAPAFNVTGPVVFTATVTDGGLDGDLATSTDNASIERSFTVHVAPVNDPPTLDAISNVNLLENAAEHAVNLGGITAGPSENQPLQVNVSSSNPNLLPSLAVQYVSPSSFGSIRFQPAVNQSGSAIVTVTVMDGGLDGNLATTTDNLMTQQTFTVDVAPVNHPPTLTINLQEDAPEQVISLTEIGAGEGESQPLLISAVSDNPDLIPEPTIDYVASATSGFLRFTPASDKHGTAIIRVSVTDGGLDQDLATTADNATLNRFLTVIVASVNDPPSFMPLSDVQLADLATLTIPIEAISAGPGEQQNLRITATSSDTTILSHPSVTYTSPDEAGTLLLQPIAGSVKSGDFVPVLVTIFLEDAGLDGDFATVGDNRLFERTLTATIISSNQPPTGLRLSVSSIAEGPALSTARIVGTLAADDDSSDQLVYALAAGQGDEDNGKFEITEDVLAIKPNALVDFESESELSVRISATDSGGLSEVVIFKITVTDENDWHNVALPLDVNKSSTVEPLDVLILINWLNAKGTSALPGVAGEPEYFLDTNNDGQVSPLDALLIINRLNNSQSEGEATYLTAPVSLSVTPEWHAVSQIVNSGKSPKVESQDFMRPQNEHRVSSKTDHAGRSREAFTRQIDLVFAEIDSTHSWIELWDKELVDDQ